MRNKWKEIWSNRVKDGDLNIEELKRNPREMFLYMKKLNGFDILEKGITYEGFMGQQKRLAEKLCLYVAVLLCGLFDDYKLPFLGNHRK